ncbi:MAG: hypothetical protein DWQ34_12655 [Planctomycetota bacterium]|nr:MAG: hypothetical protein DWQ29_16010 [Planctomycetota bacterium]REJ92587.1 MAG: hypothetical protein DWQ34_12655 [Planctomycetota bacterium]REK25555.1 MAG: hypothetical protein DWQ41_11480 [Planctomycetota bacterium]REK31733.1 MAG: hypothetical protein DWQ45_19205 [Planctomycetota bacterium]
MLKNAMGPGAVAGARYSRNCLLVLQPRAISECLESIAQLPLDKVYFRAYRERELVEPFNRFIAETRYENYLVVADDVVVTVQAYRLVAELLEAHAIATGYCRLCQGSPLLNVVKNPLRRENGKWALLSDYDFYHAAEVQTLEDPVFPTWFGGWSLTGMRREVWLEHPFRVNEWNGMQSDFEMFFRLNRPIVAHRDAYIEHLKLTTDTSLNRNVLIGRVAPETIFSPYPGGESGRAA